MNGLYDRDAVVADCTAFRILVAWGIGVKRVQERRWTFRTPSAGGWDVSKVDGLQRHSSGNIICISP